MALELFVAAIVLALAAAVIRAAWRARHVPPYPASVPVPHDPAARGEVRTRRAEAIDARTDRVAVRAKERQRWLDEGLEVIRTGKRRT
jgi:hypothetical protein